MLQSLFPLQARKNSFVTNYGSFVEKLKRELKGRKGRTEA
jgi:hypothetical protein